MVGSRLHLGDGRLCRCSCRPGILRHRGRRLRCGRLRSSSLRWRGAGRFGRFPRFLPPPPPPSPRFLVGLRQVAVLGRGFLQVFEGQLLAGSWLQPLRYVFGVQGVIVAGRILVGGDPRVFRNNGVVFVALRGLFPEGVPQPGPVGLGRGLLGLGRGLLGVGRGLLGVGRGLLGPLAPASPLPFLRSSRIGHLGRRQVQAFDVGLPPGREEVLGPTSLAGFAGRLLGIVGISALPAALPFGLAPGGEEVIEFLEEVVEAVPAVLSLGCHQTSLSSFSLCSRSSSTSEMY